MDPVLKSNHLFGVNLKILRALFMVHYKGNGFENFMRISGYVLLAIYCVQNIFEFIYLYQHFDEFISLALSWSTCLMQVVNITKLYSYLNNIGTFNELLLSMHQEMEYVEQFGEGKTKEIMNDFVSFYKKIRILIYAWTTPVAVLFYVYYFVNYFVWEGNTQLMPFEMWRPYDEHKHSNVNALSSLLLSILGVHGYYANYPYILLYLYYATCKLNILHFRISNIIEAIPQNSTMSKKQLDEQRYRYVCKCVQYHLECIQFVEKVQYVYANALAAELFAFAVILCAAALGTVLIPFGLELFINIGFAFCYSMILVFMYGVANEIIIKSIGVTDAVYKTPWYTFDVRTRRALMLMQIRSTRKLRLKAAMFDMNLDTMIRVYRATYSAYTVLRQMN